MDTPEPDIIVTIETVALFAEECIKYVLNFKNIVWHPPINLENLRRYSTADLFTTEIGKALSEEVMIDNSIEVANMAGFNINAWLQMPLDEARNYVNQRFLGFTFVLPHGVLRHLLLWTFACDLCHEAVKNGKRIFISHVLAQLVQIMYSNFKNMKHYENLDAMAVAWNGLCFALRNRDVDEGIVEGDEDHDSLYSDSD